MFGRFELRKLLGKSAACMAWLAFDPRLGHEVMLTLPRVQPRDAAGMQAWMHQARLSARLRHPHLAPPLEVGEEAHWPFISVDRALGVTLGEWLAQHTAPTPVEAVGWLCQALEGLAFAHEAGCAHRDLQLHSLLIAEDGTVYVLGLGAALDPSQALGEGASANAMPLASSHGLKQQRDAGSRDVLSCGVLLHRLLMGQAVLDEADVASVVTRMVPLGRDIVRLPWSTPHPIGEGLRAIANRCTATQERQRYLNARTLLRALTGWRDAESQDSGGPLALLIDRLGSVGHLPALPGVGARVTRLSRQEGQRTDEMAEQILQDIALSFELLRLVNSVQVQGTQVAGNGPVLTIRRCIALMGLAGVRHAATALRAWPGPLSEAGAAALKRRMDRVRWAGHVAQALRPAGYDPEVVYLVAILQNLGRLLVQYHFPEEAEQARQLMLPARAPDAATGEPELPGLTEEAASFAVLGVNSEEVGAAVARHWGLGDEVLHMIRRLPKDAHVRTADGDGERLRATASAANEAVDAACDLPPARLAQALSVLTQRYARVLNASVRDVQDALTSGQQVLRRGGRVVDAGDAGDAEEPSRDRVASKNPLRGAAA
jgi:eukaryotic-like serine/threonine-protein kinase